VHNLLFFFIYFGTIKVMFKKFIKLATSLFVLGMLLVPNQAFMQTSASSSSDTLVDAIRKIVTEAMADLHTEIKDLKQQVTALEEKITRVGSGSSVFSPSVVTSSPLTASTSVCSFGSNLSIGSRGDGVSRLQTYLNITPTGIFDEATRLAVEAWQNKRPAMLSKVGLSKGTGYWGTLSEEQCRIESTNVVLPLPVISTPEIKPELPLKPIVNPGASASVSLLSPSKNKTLNPGGSVQLKWEVKNAPVSAWLNFKLRRQDTGVEHHIQGPMTAGSGVYENIATIPNNLVEGSYDLVVYMLDGDNKNPDYLNSVSIPVNIKSTAQNTTTTNTTNNNQTSSSSTTNSSSNTSGGENNYIALYSSETFVNCMKQQGSAGESALATIQGWANSGLKRYEFPWGQLTGAIANSVPSCEQLIGINYSENYSSENYGNCYNNASESSCGAQSGCAWYGTFCEGDNYNYGGSSTGTGEMARCFYPNTTKDGTHVGWTIWCEKDYYNCHYGDPAGDSLDLTGVVLGAPSSCESGWYGGSGSTGNSNWVNKTWNFTDGSTTSYVLDRTDQEYLDYLNSVQSQCQQVSKNNYCWKDGAGDDTQWQNFGVPDCSGSCSGGGVSLIQPSTNNLMANTLNLIGQTLRNLTGFLFR